MADGDTDTVQANIDDTPGGVPGDVLNSAIDNFGGGVASTSIPFSDPFNDPALAAAFGGTDPLYDKNGNSLIGKPVAGVPLYLWLIAGAIFVVAMLKR
jgi:hypothetical protein